MRRTAERGRKERRTAEIEGEKNGRERGEKNSRERGREE